MPHPLPDVLADQHVRSANLAPTATLAAVLTDGTTLVADGASVFPVGPLLFDRDIVVLWAGVDDGKDAPVLIRELLAKKLGAA